MLNIPFNWEIDVKKTVKITLAALCLFFVAACAQLTPEEKLTQGEALYQKASERLAATSIYKPDFSEQLALAVDELKRADEYGNHDATALLSDIYFGAPYSESLVSESLKISQEEIQKNYRYYTERAAAAGIPSYQYQLGVDYYSGKMGVEKSPDKAIELWEQAANGGDRTAMSALAYHYASYYCEGCDAKFVYWSGRFMDGATARDQAAFGMNFEKGYEPFAQDYNTAMAWYQKAMDQNSDVGYHYMAHLYLFGKGVTQDYAKAKELMEIAASLEDWGGAHHHLGEMYYLGLGVKRNYQEAFKNYMIGAEQGYYGSMYMVGYMYLTGTGVKGDRTQAEKWYNQGISDEYNDGYNQDKLIVKARSALAKAFDK